jgi:O-antigen/teichoic acid export membrane protein
MFARVAKNSAAQMLGLLLSFADRFVVVGILLRAWGAEVYAGWAILLSLAGLLLFAELGLNVYYGNMLQEAWSKADRERFQRVVSIALTCSGTVALFVAVAAVSIAAFAHLVQSLSIKAIPHADAILIFLMLSFASASRLARSAISQVWRGRQEFAIGILVDLTPAASLPVLMTVAALLGASPLTMAGLYLAADLAAGWGCMLWVLSRRYPDLRIRPEMPTGAELRDIVLHGKWLALQQGGPVVWLQFPIILMGYLGVTSASLVSFLLIRTLVNFVRSLGGMLSIGSGVEIAAIHHAGRNAEVMRHLRTAGSALSAITMALAVGVFLFADPFLALWTGSAGFFDHGVLLGLLVSAVLAAPASPIASHMMLAMMPKPISIALMCQLAIGFAACVAFTPAYGTTGAAAGLALGEAIAQAIILPVLAAPALRGFGYPRYLFRCVFAMILAGGWCGLAGLGAITFIDTSSFNGFVAAATIWTALGLLPVLIVIIGEQGRGAILSRLRAPRSIAAATL